MLTLALCLSTFVQPPRSYPLPVLTQPLRHLVPRATATDAVLPDAPAVDADKEASGTSEGSASRQIVAFALPVLGACLAEPLLSMVDTVCVGRMANAASASLAALGVNSAVFNVIATSTTFLCTASTAVIGQGAGSDNDGVAARTLVDGMALALALGVLIGSGVCLASGVLLARVYHLLPGSEVHALAAGYLRVRALSTPAALATLVSAGVAFGMGDSLTPLVAVAAAMVTNVCGDLLLIPRFGLAGAAVATAAAAWVGAISLVSRLSARLRPTWRLPSASELRPFVQTSAALLSGATLCSLAYAATTSVVTAGGSLVEGAAHQVALQGWWLLSFASVPLSLAGQSLLPPLARARGEADGAAASRPRAWRFCRALLGLGATLTAPLAAANYLLCTRWSMAVVADAAVAETLRSIALPATIAQAAMNVATSLDGAYIGCGRLGHYVGVIGAATLSLAAVSLRSVSMGRAGLASAWLALAAFSCVRAGAHLWKLGELRESFVGG